LNCTVSSPGKLVISGEHSVVYGKHAFAISTSLRTHVSISLKKNSLEFSDVIQASFPLLTKEHQLCSISLNTIKELQKRFDFDPSFPSPFDAQFKTFFPLFASQTALGCILTALLPKDFSGYSIFISVSSTNPISSGLGSSASFSVSLAAAFITLFQIRAKDCCNECMNLKNKSFCNEQLSLINGWAYNIECIFHNTPSGVDNTISTNGGAILFQKGKPFKSIRTAFPLSFLVLTTNIKHSTKDIIQAVKQRFDNNPIAFNKALNEMDEIALNFYKYFSDNPLDYQSELNGLIKRNQELLRDPLKVSHEANEQAISLIMSLFPESYAKITGAGMGGSVFAIIWHNSANESSNQLKPEDYELILKSGFHPYILHNENIGVAIDSL